ncbi:hypothetical protein B0J14DRAFT_592247 [Halenospora varia]|nr:hypothetical protein B0J14DRAFT_592247 [Halenospora varia]
MLNHFLSRVFSHMLVALTSSHAALYLSQTNPFSRFCHVSIAPLRYLWKSTPRNTMANLSASAIFNVKDMVFAITGGGTGIGAMMAKALDANGAAKVYIIGRRLEKLQEVAALAMNNSIIPLQGDITSKESLQQIAEKIKSEVPYVNTVIANSGTMGPTLDLLPKSPTPSLAQFHEFLWNTPMSEFNETFMINSTAMFYTFLAFLPLLDAGNSHVESPTKKTGVKSQFVVTSSIGAYSRRPGAGFAYAGSKAAVVHMVRQMSTMMCPYGIRVNSIAPGIYPSDMSAFTTGGGESTKEGALPQAMVPAERAGSEEDMAGAILFLSSRGGAYVNGNILITDGGRLSLVDGVPSHPPLTKVD